MPPATTPMIPMSPAPTSSGTDQSYPPALVRDIQLARQKGLNDRQIAAYIRSELGPGSDSLYVQNPGAFDPAAHENALMHNLGVAGRAVANGIEGLVHTPGNLVAAAWQLAGKAGLPGGAEIAQFTQQRYGGAPQAANVLGLPEAQTPTGKVAAQALEGAVGAAPFAVGAGPLAAVSTVASGGASGAASQIAANRGASPTQQVVAGLVAQLALPTMISGTAAAARRVLAGTQAQREAAQSAQALLAAGTDQNAVTLGQVTEGGAARTIERTLRGKQLGTAGRFRKTLAAQDHGVQANLQRTVDGLAPLEQAGREAAGETAQLGINGPPPIGTLASQDEIAAILAHQDQVNAAQAKVADLVQRRDALVSSMQQATTAAEKKSTGDLLRQFDDQIAQVQNDAAQVTRQTRAIAPEVAGGLERRYPTPQTAAAARAEQMTARQVGALDQQIGELQAQMPRPNATPIVTSPKVSEGYIPRFWEQAGKLYDDAFKMVPPETPVFPSNTDQWLKLQDRALNNSIIPSATANRDIQQWIDDFAQTLDAHPNGLPFGELKRLRSQIDDKIKNFAPAVTAGAGPDLKDLLSLRGALTKDLAAMIVQRGGREGAAAWQRAQSFFADGMDKIENIFKPLVVKNTPEKVFQALMSGTKQGATILRTTMNELQPEQRRVVLSAMLRELMKGPNGEAINADAFLTNWRKLTPETRISLTQHLGVEATNNLNNVMKSVEILGKAGATLPPAYGETGGLFKNVMRVLLFGGPGVAMTGKISPLAGGAVAAGAAGTEVAARLTARVFTSPRMVRWLLGTTKLPGGVLPSMLVQLSKQAQNWPPADRAVAQEFIQQMGGSGIPTSVTAPTATDTTIAWRH